MIAAVCSAVAAVAGLLWYLFRTRWSERARWETELKRLEADSAKARLDYAQAVADGSDRHEQLQARWRVCATELASHRAAGQRAGFLDRAQ